MVTTRNGNKANANKNNAETPRTPVANNGPHHAEDEASSHPSRRDEAPVAPPPPQPSLCGEPSGSLARRACPTRAAALQLIQELLGHPPAPEGHDAWIARIRELADIAGDQPAASQVPNAGQPRSTRAPEVPAHSNGATLPIQVDLRTTNRDKPNATTQLPATRAPEKSNNSCQILRTLPEARPCRAWPRARAAHHPRPRQAGRANRPIIAASNSKVLVGGCLAFSKEMRSVTFPPKFNPSLPSRYDGTTPPLDFQQLYSLTVCAAKGDDKCIAN